MSKHINVNPGQYKEGGREHQGEQILHEVHKQQYAQAQKQVEENSSIPNQEENQTPAAGGGENRAGNATTSANTSSGDY
jgi:hypothetical protein